MTEFEKACIEERGRILTGKFAHFCFDWDEMTVDETTPCEFESCHCPIEGIPDEETNEARRKAADDAARFYQDGE